MNNNNTPSPVPFQPSFHSSLDEKEINNEIFDNNIKVFF